MENKGTGYAVIKSALNQAHMPEPEAVDTISAFALTMRKSDWAIYRDANPIEREVRNAKDRLILELLEKEGALKPSEIANRLAMPRSTVTRRVGNLHQRGLVERLGAPNSPQVQYVRTRLERRWGS